MLDIDWDLEQMKGRIRSYFGQTILKRGWDYYLDREVRDIQAESRTVLQARVSGSSMYRVTINLNSFDASRCTCPYGGYCKHLAAVLFAVCKEMGDSPAELRSPGTGARGIAPAVIQMEAPIVVNKEPMVKQPAVPKPDVDGSAIEWHSYFEKKFGAVSVQSGYYLEGFYVKAMKELSPIADDWAPVLRALYLVHMQLFLMKQFDRIYRELLEGYYYYSDNAAYFAEMDNRISKQLHEAVKHLQAGAAQANYPLLALETMDYLADHAFPELRKSEMDWPYAYRLVWWHLLNDESLIHKERIRLQALIDQGGKHSNQLNSWLMAMAHFDVMEDQDEAAMKRLDSGLKRPEAADLLGFVHEFLLLEQWDRLINWLNWLKPVMQQAGQRVINSYFYYWKEASRHREVDQEWRQAAIALLPGSLRVYSSFLLEKERFQEWVDVCLLMDLSPFEISTQDLKQIEADNPRWLLPFYHHAVERYIQEKNRDSYKRAVRLLKKLRQAYKKLKEQSRFEDYIKQVSRQYSRYRALQEEMRKGKLIV